LKKHTATLAKTGKLKNMKEPKPLSCSLPAGRQGDGLG